MRAAILSVCALLAAGPAMAQADIALPGGGDAGADRPTPIDRQPAVYPEEAPWYGVEAACIVTYVITDTGATADHCVACSNSPHARDAAADERLTRQFEDASLTAVSAWRFTPDGSGRRYQTELDFELSNQITDTKPEAPSEDACGPGLPIS